MTQNNERAVIGGNNPPDPIDEALAPFGDMILEVENWCDGDPVESEEQLAATNALLKDIKGAAKAVGAARDAVTQPLNKAWKDEIARWKPTIEDIDRLVKGLIAAQDPYKRKLAAKVEAEKRAAWDAAQKARREAEALAAAAKPSDIEALREIAAAQQAVIDAEKAAQAAQKSTVKGMRTVHKYEITDHRDALHWIAVNDREAMTAFIEAYVNSNHKTANIDGVKTWTEKEAF